MCLKTGDFYSEYISDREEPVKIEIGDKVIEYSVLTLEVVADIMRARWEEETKKEIENTEEV